MLLYRYVRIDLNYVNHFVHFVWTTRACTRTYVYCRRPVTAVGYEPPRWGSLNVLYIRIDLNYVNQNHFVWTTRGRTRTYVYRRR